MRLISLVITLLIIAIILYKQLGGRDSETNKSDSSGGTVNLKVPIQPEDIPKFEKDLDAFAKDKAEETKKRIEEAEK